MAIHIRRREFVTLLGGTAASWPLTARAQQPVIPVVSFVNGRSAEDAQRIAAAFRKGLNETGYVEGQNVMVEYYWVEGEYRRLPSLVAGPRPPSGGRDCHAWPHRWCPGGQSCDHDNPDRLLRRRRPVKLGLVDSLARPGGNATGINFFVSEVLAKRLGLLHDLVPKAVRIAVLVNPANAPLAETTLRDIPEAARALGLQIEVLNASTSREIEVAFATLVRDRADALFVGPDALLTSQRVQIATLAMHHGIPTACNFREEVEAGGLMSYGTDNLDTLRQVGVYTGQILKGAKPGDLPVLQPTKFEFVINLQTARALGIDVPSSLQLLADELILTASTNREIDAAFASLVQKRAEALLIGPDVFFTNRRVQLATLAVRHGVPAIYSFREFAEAGGLMSYGTSNTDRDRQVGVYAGRILKGEKPADLPILQPTKFEFVINLQTARTLGLEVPPTLLARADEVIE
jgi:putative ABC transport system substrate-binding protein